MASRIVFERPSETEESTKTSKAASTLSTSARCPEQSNGVLQPEGGSACLERVLFGAGAREQEDRLDSLTAQPCGGLEQGYVILDRNQAADGAHRERRAVQRERRPDG
jgi:hypothetical protein